MEYAPLVKLRLMVTLSTSMPPWGSVVASVPVYSPSMTAVVPFSSVVMVIAPIVSVCATIENAFVLFAEDNV